MEFLPHAGSTASASSSTTLPGGRVRIAYFLRPRDISSRYLTDYHLVVATMSSEVVDASYLRMKVSVKHRDTIVDLERYKKRENAFYFHQVSIRRSVSLATSI